MNRILLKLLTLSCSLFKVDSESVRKGENDYRVIGPESFGR